MQDLVLSPVSVPDLVNMIASEVQARLIDMQNPEKINPKPGNDLLDSKELCQKYKISYTTRHEWTKKGLLTAYKIGHKIFYRSEEVEKNLVQLQKK